MKTKITLSLFTFWLIIGSGCIPFKPIKGDGNLVTHQISIDDYNKIGAFSSSMKINYVRSDEAPFLEVTTDQNIYEKYDFIIEHDNQLSIKPKKEYRQNNFRPTEFNVTTNSRQLIEIIIAGSIEFVTNSSLSGDGLKFEVAGSGSIYFNDTVIGDKVKMNIAGNGEIHAVHLVSREFHSEIAGSGKLNLAGQADRASYNIAGSGEVRGFDFITNDIKGEIAGSGDLEIYANNSIKVDIAGSGEIKYKGDPEEPSIKVAGSGSVTKVE
ncbi:head GIN domain-containing protein [Parabacteroides sp. PF5-9]|uniref:head GIN domain-containing protein n=1 Tax=Parabacteroides sp. PF5-9 TaxID=1742404 RepID=UPI0024768E24|nr:head GIN domain-containing protein [Parabacteroides sp. PF5-9]MDH6357910.1 hypothetical protein [Parabacteroides sp. PF5-9]